MSSSGYTLFIMHSNCIIFPQKRLCASLIRLFILSNCFDCINKIFNIYTYLCWRSWVNPACPTYGSCLCALIGNMNIVRPKVDNLRPTFFFIIKSESLHVFIIATWSSLNRGFTFFCLDYRKRWIWAKSYYCNCWTLILCANTQKPQIQKWVTLTSVISTLLFAYPHVL